MGPILAEVVARFHLAILRIRRLGLSPNRNSGRGKKMRAEEKLVSRQKDAQQTSAGSQSNNEIATIQV
jgi:hypothetical protein